MLFKGKLRIFLLVLISNWSIAQLPGALDTSFNGNGKVITSFGNYTSRGFAIAIQPDGKIVSAGCYKNGTYDFALVRYHSNGLLDSTFGINGKVITNVSSGNDQIWCIDLQTDGKIVVGGESYNGPTADFVLARYDTSGVLDSGFGNNGIQITSVTSGDDYANSVKVIPSGKIYIAGTFALARYNSSGILDTSFNSTGIVLSLSQNMILESMVLQADERIIVAGYVNGTDFAVARYDSTGILDSSFNGNGIVLTDMGSNLESIISCEVQLDGKIVVGGGTDFTGTGQNWEFALARYNSDGILDSSFNSNGKVITAIGPNRDIINEIKIQSDGKIVAAGYSGEPNINFALVRYNANGSLDNTFGNGGIVITDFAGDWDIIDGLAIQSDGKLVTCGGSHIGNYWNFALARYISGLNIGLIDFSVVTMAPLIYPNPVQTHAQLKYTLNKDENLSVRLFNINGMLVKTFINNEHRIIGEHNEDLNFSESMAPGNYVLSIDNGTAQQAIKIIIQ